MRVHLGGWGLVVLLAALGACSGFGADSAAGTPADADADAGADGGLQTVGGPAAGSFTLNAITATTQIVRGESAKVTVSVNRNDSVVLPVVITLRGFRDKITSKALTLTANSADLEIDVQSGAATGEADGFVDAKSGPFSLSTPLKTFVRGQPGELDVTYGTGGSVAKLFPGLASNGGVAALLLAPDDSVYVVAACTGGTCISHLSPTGAVDSTYGSGGVATLGFGSPNAAAMHTDGSIVVVSNTRSAGNYAGKVDATGKADITFGTGAMGPGTVLLGTGGLDGSNYGGTAVAIRFDGDIFIAWADDIALTGAKEALMHLDPDGGIRTGFGVGGTARSGDFASTTALVVRNRPTSGSRGNPFRVWVDRSATVKAFEIDGDTAGVEAKFGAAPKTVTISGAGQNDFAPAGLGAVELSDESIVAAFRVPPSVALRKYTVSGDGDPTFGTAGTAGPFAIKAFPNHLAVQPDGKFLIAGSYDDGTFSSSGQVLARFTAGGTLDPTFRPSVPLTAKGSADRVVVQKTGRILVGGAVDSTSLSTVTAYWP